MSDDNASCSMETVSNVSYATSEIVCVILKVKKNIQNFTFNGVRQSTTVLTSFTNCVVSSTSLSLLFTRKSKMNSKKFIFVVQKFLFIFGGSPTSGVNRLSSLKTFMARAIISSDLLLAKHFVAALAMVVRKHGTTGISEKKCC